MREEIRYGEWRRFLEVVEWFRGHRGSKAYLVREARLGTNGPESSPVLVYRSDDAKTFDADDRAIAEVPERGRFGSAIPDREGTIVRELFREA